jgi:hypothetical protein
MAAASRYTGIVTADEPTPLWALRKDDDEVSCQVRLVPYGIEVDLVRNGKVTLTRVFATDSEALEWSDAKRTTREADGWRRVEPAPATSQRPPA